MVQLRHHHLYHSGLRVGECFYPDKEIFKEKRDTKVRSKMYLNFDAASPLVITQNPACLESRAKSSCQPLSCPLCIPGYQMKRSG